LKKGKKQKSRLMGPLKEKTQQKNVTEKRSFVRKKEKNTRGSEKGRGVKIKITDTPQAPQKSEIIVVGENVRLRVKAMGPSFCRSRETSTAKKK